MSRYGLLMPLQQRIRAYYKRWLRRRVPPQKQQQLYQRNIFIFPSLSGLTFLCLIILLWLLGTNYQNNLILALSFLLLSLMIVSILHTYANLSGLQFTLNDTTPGFVGAHAQITLTVKRTRPRHYQAVIIHWAGGASHSIDLASDAPVTLTLSVPVTQRGYADPGRLKINTVFPLGVIRAWAYLDFDTLLLGYPKPIENDKTPQQHSLDDTDDQYAVKTRPGNGDEFAGIREYQPGDSPRQINWRSLARGQGLATKLFEHNVDQYLWLDWQQFSGLSTEVRLSQMCFCVLAIEQSTMTYGLRLPGIDIAPAQGASHQQAVLSALATFDMPAVDRVVNLS